MDLSFLPVNIFSLIMEVSSRPTVAVMTRTCHTLRTGGTRFLLSGGVSLPTEEEITSFALFIHADPGHRFQHFRSLEFPNGKCTAELAATLLGIISHPSLVLDSLTLWNAESFLWSTPTPSKSPDFQDHPDQAPFVSAFARLTTLRHLRLMQCGQCARHLLTTLRSPLKSVCIGFQPSIYGFWSMLREGDWFDRNPILLLRNVTDSLEELSSVNFGEPHVFGDSVPVYPFVRRLTMTICKGGLRAFPIDNLVSYITAFPNLTHISLISENSDGSLMGCFYRRYGDATYSHGNRRRNRRAQAVHGRTWMHLEEVSGGLHEVRSLGLACRVSCVRVTGGIWSDTIRLVPTVLEDTRPTRLALTILGAGTFDNDSAAAVFRDPNTQQIQTLELTLCFSPEEELEDVNVVVKNVIRSLGSLPALRNVIFTLNSGLVCPPTEAYRARRGWHSRTEREVDGLDLEACATLFRKAIPTLVDVTVRCSKDRTRWDSEALYGPDWQLPNLEY